MNRITSAGWAAAGLVLASPLAAQQRMTTDASTRAAAEAPAPEDWGTPGEYHQALARMAGTWDVKIHVAGHGATPAREFRAEAVIQPTMDERYVEENLSGGSREHPYRAHGVTGFNNLTHKVESVRFDNASTALQSSTGEMSLPGDEFNLHGRAVDPMTRRPVDTRSVVKILSDDEFAVTDYRMVGRQETKTMERLYSRK